MHFAVMPKEERETIIQALSELIARYILVGLTIQMVKIWMIALAVVVCFSYLISKVLFILKGWK